VCASASVTGRAAGTGGAAPLSRRRSISQAAVTPAAAPAAVQERITLLSLFRKHLYDCGSAPLGSGELNLRKETS